MHNCTVSPKVIALKLLFAGTLFHTPARQSLSSLLAFPSEAARRRHSPSAVQHCAAMGALFAHFCARPAEVLTVSSPGHRQKSTRSVLEPPARTAMPDSGMGKSGGLAGGDGGGVNGGGVERGGRDGGGVGHGSPE